jgi:hypothetical protein
MNKKYKSTIRSTLFTLKIPKVYKETIIGSGSFSTEALCHSIVNHLFVGDETTSDKAAGDKTTSDKAA